MAAPQRPAANPAAFAPRRSFQSEPARFNANLRGRQTNPPLRKQKRAKLGSGSAPVAATAWPAFVGGTSVPTPFGQITAS
ncbi:hypothetical protein GLE_1972 [Lysobacter enzymogenes]|uniref:Uncharacterized protein n=1 Tax=Lysobacter enzymogenes TaxID=69 RepID=A0A0S2DFM1_LYSEN|nr:hypothetical protein GLE_1972 [Lysobacter enzymogenes]